MLPARFDDQEDDEGPDAPESQMMDLERLAEFRADDRLRLSFRRDMALDFEYADGNQYSEDDRQLMQEAGIPMVVNNRIARHVNDVVGLKRSYLTDWLVTSEDGDEEMTMALGQKLKEAQRMTKADQVRLSCFKDEYIGGMGWAEVGRNADSMRYPYRVAKVPWREMFWDWRSTEPDLSDCGYIRRVKWYYKDVLMQQFEGREARNAIEDNLPQQDQWSLLIEPSPQYRDFQKNNWRDPPLSWNITSNQFKNMRCLEEVWYPVHLEGPCVFLPNGRVMAYDQCDCNPMIDLAVRSGIARVEDAPYTRWRQAFWIGTTRMMDRWSPLPFEGTPYVPFWGYREDMTGIRYGAVRVMRSLQDVVNNLEGRMMFSMSAVRIKVKEGSTDIQELRRQAGNKRGVIVIKDEANMDDVQIDEHLALNAQHYQLYQDSKMSLEEVGGTAGLNPASMPEGKPRSAAQAQTLALRAMATLGELDDNDQTAWTCIGTKLLGMIRQDVEKRGSVGVKVNKPTGEKKVVMLHHKVGDHNGMPLISNDVTLFNANVVLDEVPHTATWRSQQFELVSNILQSMPPEAVDIRRIMLPRLVEMSDLPGAKADAQMLREQSGLAPPQTPEALAAQQAQQQDAQLQKELQVKGAMAQIGQHQSKAALNQSLAQKAQIETAKIQHEAQSPAELDKALIAREKQLVQIGQVRAKTAKTIADTGKVVTESQASRIPANW